MGTGGDFGDDAAVFGEDVDLGGDDIRKDVRAVFDDGRGGFVAGGFEAKDFHRLNYNIFLGGKRGDCILVWYKSGKLYLKRRGIMRRRRFCKAIDKRFLWLKRRVVTSHYRAVMGTTVDCEGCEFDSIKGCRSDEGCVLFNGSRVTCDYSGLSVEELEREIVGMLE